jgi:hypothetical protein
VPLAEPLVPTASIKSDPLSRTATNVPARAED